MTNKLACTRTIYVDNRVGSKELMGVIPNAAKATELTRLAYGDAYWIGNGPDGPCTVGVERKTLTDLLSSIDSGRLSGHQLLGMTNTYDYNYLLLEGIWRASSSGILQHFRRGQWQDVALGNSRRRYMTSEVDNYLNSLAMMCGIHIWQTSTLAASGQWLTNTHSWWSKKWSDHKSHQQFHIDLPPTQGVLLKRPSLLRRVLKEFEGIGWEKSKLVADRYNDSLLEFVLAATDADLRNVPGIGKVLAAKITKQMDGK